MIQDVLGLFIRPISYFVPIKEKHWVFSADYGQTYREGSKYLLEYMLTNHPDYDCCFITRNSSVVRELQAKGIPVAHNMSFKGICKILIADCVFTTQSVNDICFAYKKKNRNYFYLVHGQPFKKAWRLIPKSYYNDHTLISQKLQKLKTWCGIFLGVGYYFNDVSFVSATSQFTASLMRNEFDKSIDVNILGMPRNDALFQPERMSNEKWINISKNKTIITYMPTHRKFGQGEVSPIPFLQNKEAQEWMRANHVVFLVKQHPNMVNRKVYIENESSEVIIDISKMGLDPQVVIYYSDILVTDYSSVWMDYLLLKRPLIFYFYDDFETNDVGCYYNLREEFPNNFCESEKSLLQMVKKAVKDPSGLAPSDSEISKFHKYIDGNSCQRYFEHIRSMKGY